VLKDYFALLVGLVLHQSTTTIIIVVVVVVVSIHKRQIVVGFKDRVLAIIPNQGFSRMLVITLAVVHFDMDLVSYRVELVVGDT
jgi:hypothetical protein